MPTLVAAAPGATNIVHGWRKLARERDAAAVVPRPTPAIMPAKAATSVPQFVPVSLTPPAAPPTPADIQIELRRGATALKITWPITAAENCAAWMRELLR